MGLGTLGTQGLCFCSGGRRGGGEGRGESRETEIDDGVRQKRAKMRDRRRRKEKKWCNGGRRGRKQKTEKQE